MSAKMEKAEILEMTVEYVSQLHGARCRWQSSDVRAGAPTASGKSHAEVRDDLRSSDWSSASSPEYRAGYSECLVHVQSFLADYLATAVAADAAETTAEIALPQQLIGHLSQFVVDGRWSKDENRVAPPSPDTTLGILSPPGDAPPPCATSRQIVLRNGVFASGKSVLSGHHALPAFAMPIGEAVGRDQRDDEVGTVIDQSSSSSSELDLRYRPTAGAVSVAPPPAIVQPSSSSSSASLPSPSTSTSTSFDCACSPGRISGAAVQPASPSNTGDHDVWRPWKARTSTCCDVSEASGASPTV